MHCFPFFEANAELNEAAAHARTRRKLSLSAVQKIGNAVMMVRRAKKKQQSANEANARGAAAKGGCSVRIVLAMSSVVRALLAFGMRWFWSLALCV